MPKSKKLVVCGVLASMLCSMSAIADEFPADKDGYKQLRIARGISQAENYIELLTPFMDEFRDMEEGRRKLCLTMNEIDGGISFDIINSGFADDSVSGQQFKGIIIKSDHGWELIELYQRWICARGKRSDKGICP